MQILTDITQREEGVNGVTRSSFIKYLFPHYAELGGGLYELLLAGSKSTANYMEQSAFKQQAEKFLSIMNDQSILENYVKIFSPNKEENEVFPDGLRELLMVSYRLAMAGTGGSTCLQLLNTVQAVVTACVSIIAK